MEILEIQADAASKENKALKLANKSSTVTAALPGRSPGAASASASASVEAAGILSFTTGSFTGTALTEASYRTLKVYSSMVTAWRNMVTKRLTQSLKPLPALPCSLARVEPNKRKQKPTDCSVLTSLNDAALGETGELGLEPQIPRRTVATRLYRYDHLRILAMLRLVPLFVAIHARFISFIFDQMILYMIGLQMLPDFVFYNFFAGFCLFCLRQGNPMHSCFNKGCRLEGKAEGCVLQLADCRGAWQRLPPRRESRQCRESRKSLGGEACAPIWSPTNANP
jgi:hypothetical protein